MLAQRGLSINESTTLATHLVAHVIYHARYKTRVHAGGIMKKVAERILRQLVRDKLSEVPAAVMMPVFVGVGSGAAKSSQPYSDQNRYGNSKPDYLLSHIVLLIILNVLNPWIWLKL